MKLAPRDCERAFRVGVARRTELDDDCADKRAVCVDIEECGKGCGTGGGVLEDEGGEEGGGSGGGEELVSLAEGFERGEGVARGDGEDGVQDFEREGLHSCG